MRGVKTNLINTRSTTPFELAEVHCWPLNRSSRLQVTGGKQVRWLGKKSGK